MKTVTIYSLSVLFGIVTLFSCQETQDNVPEYEGPGREGKITFQLTSDTAQARIQRYADYVDELSDSLVASESTSFPNSKKILVHGAKVEMTEFRRMQRWCDSLENAGDSVQIYTMLGTKGSSALGKAEVIFCVESYKEEADPTLLFFNFTRPCPTSCPSWMPSTER